MPSQKVTTNVAFSVRVTRGADGYRSTIGVTPEGSRLTVECDCGLVSGSADDAMQAALATIVARLANTTPPTIVDDSPPVVP